MKCLFLYNPKSGKGYILKRLRIIEKELAKHFDEFDMVATKSGKDLEEKACAGADEYDVILFSGGDGTFNHVLQGVGDKKVKLGYIPAGTANDVARSLGIPKNVKKALKLVFDGHTQKVDCMLVNGSHYCMYIAAAGAFTEITYRTPQNQKAALGRVAYAIQGLKYNMRLKIFPVDVNYSTNNIRTTAVFIFVLNGRSVGGFPLNKHASMQDGILEAAIIKQVEAPNAWQKLRAYASMAALFLHGVKVKRRDIEIFRGSTIDIDTNTDVVWDFDGEEGVKGTIHVEALKEHVEMFVPKKKKI